MSIGLSTAGFLVVDKPRGWTSSDVVRKLKGAFGLGRLGLKIGHCGTLDPLATGVLPISIGAATRFSRYVLEGDKSYSATITLGLATDSYDSDGEVTATLDASTVTRANIDLALVRYVGEFDQVPPLFSAVKVQGRRAYSVARSGGVAEMASRRVRVESLTVTEWDSPHLTVHITCGKGFYVRSFAHDLGIDLGCGGHLSQLRRTSSGVFNGEDSVQLDALLGGADTGAWVSDLHQVDAVLQHMPSVRLDYASSFAFSHGNSVEVGSEFASDEVRVYSEEGVLLGLGDGRRFAGKVAPRLVIRDK